METMETIPEQRESNIETIPEINEDNKSEISEISSQNDEIKEIEKEVLEIKEQKSLIIPEISQIKKRGRKKSEKGQLMQDIIDFHIRSNLSPPSNKTLYKKSMDELHKILANLIQNGTNNLINPSKNEMIGEFKKTNNKYQNIDLSLINIDMATEALYKFNWTLSILFEKTVSLFENDSGFNINGYSDKLAINKEELLKYYALLYKQYTPQIEQYITPFTSILMVNIGCIGASFKFKHTPISKEELMNH